jgi:hypothetical protein
MKNLLTATLVISCFALFSCQKEVDGTLSNGGSNNGGTSGTKLTKTLEKLGGDSLSTVYRYNSSGKIIGVDMVGVDAGQPYDYYLTYVRNNSGIIQKQIIKSSDLVQFGVDSVLSLVSYDAASNKYKSAVSNLSLFGIPIIDSIVFQYDGSGRLITEIDYSDVGFGYLPSWKRVYTYNGSNLGTEKYYSFDINTNNYTLDYTATYEYDTKINPLQFVADAAILNLEPFYSANNITKLTYVTSDPADNFVSTVNYTYNSTNRPLTDVTTTASEVTTTSYYYQ